MSHKEKIASIELKKLDHEKNQTAANVVAKSDRYTVIKKPVVGHHQKQTETSNDDLEIKLRRLRNPKKQTDERIDASKKQTDERTSVNEINVESLHLSCQSDVYKPSRRYAGIIIYQRNGESEWRTANNTHCKTGYIVIQDTDSEDVKKFISKEPGAVHGAVYRNAFGESVNQVEVVGEGFTVQNGFLRRIFRGKFGNTSKTFNSPPDSEWHDTERSMHPVSERCVKKVVNHWKEAGASFTSKQRNFKVKELMQDTDENKKWSCSIL